MSEGSAEPTPAAGPAGAGILTNAAFRLLADLGAKVATIVLFVVMARRLGDAGFGVFTFALAYVTLVTALGDFGQAQLLTREVARDHSRLDDLFYDILALRAALALPALAVAVAVATAAFEPATRDAILLLGLSVVADLLAATVFAAFQAFERLVWLPVVLIPQRALTAAGGVLALTLGGGVVAVAAVFLAGSLLAQLAAVAIMRRQLPVPRRAVTPGRWRGLMRVALPIGLAGVFATILFRVDIVLLGVLDSDTAVGDYGAAYRLLETTLFISWAVGGAAFPVLSRLRPGGDPPLERVFSRTIKLAVAFTAPLAVGGGVLAEPVLRLLYGADFENAATALRLLAPTIVLYPVGHVAGYLLVGQDRQRVLATTYGVAALLNIALNLVLIPSLSLDGAALATTVSELFVVIALLVGATRVCDIELGRALAAPAAGAAAAGAVMLALHDSLVLAAPAGGLAYLALAAGLESRLFADDLRWIVERVRR